MCGVQVDARVFDPVLETVKLNGAADAAHMRQQILGGRGGRAVGRPCVSGRHQVVPDAVVVVQIQQCSVHVQQDGVDAVPVQRQGMAVLVRRRFAHVGEVLRLLRIITRLRGM